MNCCLVEFERKKKRSSPHVYAAWTNAGRVVHRGLASANATRDNVRSCETFGWRWISVGSKSNSLLLRDSKQQHSGSKWGPISPHSRLFPYDTWNSSWGKQENMNIIQVPLFTSEKKKQIQGRSCIMLREYIWLCCVGWKHSHFLLDRVNSSFQKRWHCSSFFYSTSVGVSVLSFGHWVVAHYSYKSVGLFHLVLYIYRTSATK